MTLQLPLEPKLPWSDLPQRWGHPWHPMSSYLGTFPAGLARSLITMLSDEGDVVLDPFAGRGTSLLEARACGRIPLASDLNPIAIALTCAKNVDVTLRQVLERLDRLERAYDPQIYLPEAHVEPNEIQLIFHVRTLAQLCYMRRRLVPAETAVDTFLVGAVLGVMHGSERQDGSSSYASISMPNTFSMSPEYVRRFVEIKRLQRVERNVFELLRRKVERLFKNYTPLTSSGVVVRADAKAIADMPELAEFAGRVKLVLTSPPYLDVVNYAKQNWIRLWFLGEGANDVHSALDDNLTLNGWLEFMDQALHQAARMINPEGVIVFVIGDVVKSSRSVVSLAREFLRRVIFRDAFAYVGCLSDHLEIGLKTTRIWADTRGRATTVDRIIFFSNQTPSFRGDRLANELAGNPLFQSFSHIDAARLRASALSFAG